MPPPAQSRMRRARLRPFPGLLCIYITTLAGAHRSGARGSRRHEEIRIWKIRHGIRKKSINDREARTGLDPADRVIGFWAELESDRGVGPLLENNGYIGRPRSREQHQVPARVRRAAAVQRYHETVRLMLHLVSMDVALLSR